MSTLEERIAKKVAEHYQQYQMRQNQNQIATSLPPDGSSSRRVPSMDTSVKVAQEGQEVPQKDNGTLNSLTLEKSGAVSGSLGSETQNRDKKSSHQTQVQKILQEQRESLMSCFTFSSFTENTEEHEIWDNNRDIRVAAAVNDGMPDKTAIQQFLLMYKMRFGGFPGFAEQITNEQVIQVAVKFAAQNKTMFKKYFPTK